MTPELFGDLVKIGAQHDVLTKEVALLREQIALYKEQIAALKEESAGLRKLVENLSRRNSDA